MNLIAKTIISATILFLINNFQPILSMETEELEREEQKAQVLILTLPSELLFQIFREVLFNSDMLIDSADIYEAQVKINPYLSQSIISIIVTCKRFHEFKDHLIRLKSESHEFYKTKLKEIFLEERTLEEGLYPKTGNWGPVPEIDPKIAKFMLENDHTNDPIITIIVACDSMSLKSEKLIQLLLFFGADVNIPNEFNETSLNYVARPQNVKSLGVILPKFKNTKVIKDQLDLARYRGNSKVIALLEKRLGEHSFILNNAHHCLLF